MMKRGIGWGVRGIEKHDFIPFVTHFLDLTLNLD